MTDSLLIYKGVLLQTTWQPIYSPTIELLLQDMLLQTQFSTKWLGAIARILQCLRNCSQLLITTWNLPVKIDFFSPLPLQRFLNPTRALAALLNRFHKTSARRNNAIMEAIWNNNGRRMGMINTNANRWQSVRLLFHKHIIEATLSPIMDGCRGLCRCCRRPSS